jgi:lia operon protein LiaF
MSSFSLAIFLIAFGVGFLLHNLGIIGFTPWVLIWPGVLIWFSISQLVRISRERKGSQDSWEIAWWLVVATLGVYLLLPKLGIRVPSIPWGLVWPLVLILLGIAFLIPDRRGKQKSVKIFIGPEGTGHRVEFRRAILGEFTRGPGSWVLEDLSLHQAIGDVNLDLTNAIIPEREVLIDISGYIGEASIYLPPGLPFKAECSVGLGEVSVLDLSESGSGRQITHQSPDYDQAVKKVNITAHWKIGEISIRQIR